MTDLCEKFIGRAILLDPATGADTEWSAYVCILLTGKARVPSILVCETQDFGSLLSRLRSDELLPHFKRAKTTFDPPGGDHPSPAARARQRYEALELPQIYRVQAVL